jgi:hypothetical protein
MNSQSFAPLLQNLFGELVFGSPDPKSRTYMLNRGDSGLLASLDRLSAAQASVRQEGGASIAAHADHLRYSFSLLNRWATGTLPPIDQMDWTVSWRKTTVTDAEWEALRAELRRESAAWSEVIRTPREVSEIEAGWIMGSVAHVAYHLGAMRQIERTARGPTAEDEARIEAELRGS